MDWCEPHTERAGQRVPATRKVNGTPMCERCFRGDAIRKSEVEGSTTEGEPPEGRRPVGIEAFFQWARRRNIAVETTPDIVNVLEEE